MPSTSSHPPPSTVMPVLAVQYPSRQVYYMLQVYDFNNLDVSNECFECFISMSQMLRCFICFMCMLQLCYLNVAFPTRVLNVPIKKHMG
jgi:hypothetical protein